MADYSCDQRTNQLILLIFGCLLALGSSKNDEFFEELYVKPLTSGHISFYFQFTTEWNISVHNMNTEMEIFQHYRLFPKSLGDVLAAYHVQELHLTQTQGRWRHQSWGYPVDDAPSGAQLWVWFKPLVTDVDKTWKELVNALSGLFCSSLNFLDEKVTVAPRWSFRPRGITISGYATHSKFVRYGALPREIVCTENLTPWKKLLPCDSKAGLSTLFKAENLYDAEYHSLAVHFRPVCADSTCTSYALELTQSLSLVVDAVLASKGYQNWSLRKVFGQGVQSHCPLASRSQIFVDTSTNMDGEIFTLHPAPNEEESSEARKLAIYDVDKQVAERRVLNIDATYNVKFKYGSVPSPPVHAHRYITGYGLEKGGVSCLIYNSLHVPVSVFYMDSFPWFTRVFFRSLGVESRDISVPYKVHYIPGRDRERPYHVELSFTVPPKAVTKISLQFERAFLKWTEYPPDANHGFYINSAVISLVLPSDKTFIVQAYNTSTLKQMLSDNSSTYFLRLYTETLLVSLPTPDFSMPYNVICLACTVVAIAFGSIHNLTTRRFVLLDPSKKKGLIARLKSFLRRRKDKSPEPAENIGTSDVRQETEIEEKVNEECAEDLEKKDDLQSQKE